MAMYGSSRQANECLCYLASFPHSNPNAFWYCMKSRIFFQCTALPIAFSVKTSANTQVNIWQKIKREPKAQFWSFFSKLYTPLKYYALKILVKSTILIFDLYSLCPAKCFSLFWSHPHVLMRTKCCRQKAGGSGICLMFSLPSNMKTGTSCC